MPKKNEAKNDSCPVVKKLPDYNEVKRGDCYDLKVTQKNKKKRLVRFQRNDKRNKLKWKITQNRPDE